MSWKRWKRLRRQLFSRIAGQFLHVKLLHFFCISGFSVPELFVLCLVREIFFRHFTEQFKWWINWRIIKIIKTFITREDTLEHWWNNLQPFLSFTFPFISYFFFLTVSTATCVFSSTAYWILFLLWLHTHLYFLLMARYF